MLDDLQERGQVYLPQGVLRKHQEELAQMGYSSTNPRSSSEDTEQIP